ncbi:MAG: NUDIX domain-containing protein [Dehalococcoidia bacterium]|nr:MAG: NUDIX domain-containing protein [Dehalococcoidia bacterium]
MAQARTTLRKISAGVILVDPQGRVLMQLRDNDPAIMFPGHWGLTGGAGLAGETPEQTARREVVEETGLTLGRVAAFRAYYFQETPEGTRSGARKRSADYELYLFHAPCTTPAEELVCGEGRELRFFSPEDVDDALIAYNHREVLDDFFGSTAYAEYVQGRPFAADAEAVDPLAGFRAAIEAGDHWFDAMMRAIAAWERADETVGGRHYQYLIDGEAFDWLLLAERLVAEAGDRVPDFDAERLLFFARPPVGALAHVEHAPAARIADDDLRGLIGDARHRAHLNFLYGVTVEEALQYAVELEVSKERHVANMRDPRSGDAVLDPVYERIYDRPRADLLAQFRDESRLPRAPEISLAELRRFMYWLFKYRVANCEPARVASDTRKALAQLSSMEAAVRRSTRQVVRA